MIGPYLTRLNRVAIALASTSVQRRRLLEQIGLRFEVVPSTFEENLDKASFEKPEDYARRNAELKAQQVAESRRFDVVIGCDTIVYYKGQIFEKPHKDDVARKMLTALSNSWSEVHSGVAIVSMNESNGYTVRSFNVTTRVKFSNLTDQVVNAYIATGEPLDKAGAYAIQGFGAALISGIEGDYFNVIGLPVNRLCIELCRLIEEGSLKLPMD